MAFRHCELGMLIRLDPDKARRQVLRAFRRNGGHLVRTADALAVHPATLKRWMHALSLHADVAAIRERAA